MIQQCESRLNGKNIEIAKHIIELKLESQGMNKYIPELKKMNNLRSIIQIEGRTSRWYFRKWSDSLNKEWNFTGRHGRSSSQNSSAIDPINTMLNLGYSILVQQMSEIIIKRGFDENSL